MGDEPFLRTLHAKLAEWPGGANGPIAVAFSGGLDSTLLLAALARLAPPGGLRALHVDHGLHADSARWEAHCRETAGALRVGYSAVRVSVDGHSGKGLEAAARTARYRALRTLVGDGETLVTAHHADDQLETLLLRLVRGSGARGLRGIVEHSTFGRGLLGRPLLSFTRAELRARAQVWGLTWLEDPSNADPVHDRNYLRHRVLPLLAARWPQAPRAAQRLARQMGEAESLLEDTARADAAGLARPDRVPRTALLALPPARRRNLLRHLVRVCGLTTPSARQLEEVESQIEAARGDAQTRVAWPGGEARVYRDVVHLLAPLPPPSPPGFTAALTLDRVWRGAEGCVDLVASPGPGLPQSWLEAGLTLKFRAGGERFRPLGRASGTTLKHWLQENEIVPWMRGRLPLIYRGERLVAVADLVLDDAVRDAPGEPRWRVRWSEHPPVT